VNSGEPGLAGVEIKVFRDGNNNGLLDAPATDPQIGSAITTPASGEWAVTSGLARNNTYFVVRTSTLPVGYASTNAIAESVALGTDPSAATKVSNDHLKVVVANGTPNQYSSNNAFPAHVANRAPVAVDDNAITNEDTALAIDAAFNDTDVDGTSPTVKAGSI